MNTLCDTFRLDYKGLGELNNFLGSPANYKSKTEYENQSNSYILSMGTCIAVLKNGKFHECVVLITTRSKDKKLTERKLNILRQKLS